jgi:hypothetical protein
MPRGQAAVPRSSLTTLVATLLLLICTRAAGAFDLVAGDLLISDYNGARVLTVDPTTGVVFELTPRPGSGPNLLVAPGEIAATSDGGIFVVDNTTNQLIGIDPTTGAQSVVQGGTAASPHPLNVGTGPWGLAADDQGHLFVAARESAQVLRIAPTLTAGIYTSTPVATSATLADARGIGWVANQSPDLDVSLGTVGETSVSTTLGTVGTPGSIVADGAAYDVARIGGTGTYQNTAFLPVSVTTIVSLPGGGFVVLCDTAQSGVYFAFHSLTNAYSTGGYFRCPLAVAATEAGAVYVTDAGAPLPGGGDARVVSLGPPGAWNTQTLVATIPNSGPPTSPVGIAVMPVTVPEPAAELAACAVLLSLGIESARRRAA